MANTGFLSPLTLVLLLFATFGGILSVNSPNITADESALLALKSGITYDPRNFLATNWSASTSACNWIGVMCESRVVSLNLSSMGLTGTIPSQLGNLSSLAWLDISQNSFHGSLPIELANLHRLEYFNFGSNNFEGQIPSWFGYFTQLRSLFLHGNNFTGEIPSTLGNLSKLEKLILYDNGFKGQIPITVGNLSNLKWIDIHNNSLSGHLSSGIFDNLTKLRKLNLSRNQISGRIPTSLFRCKELTYLSLYNNSLDGNIPVEIGNLTMLNSLLLGYNNLTGSIPSSIFNVSSLQEIVLGNNNLFGHLSSNTFDYLPRLLRLDLVGIQLSGRIPSTLFKCKQLQYLELYDNHFETDKVPLQITNLTSLVYFSIPKTNLSGEIPQFIGNMTSLEYIDLSYNNLRGEIPHAIQNLPSLREFFVLENKLSDYNLGVILMRLKRARCGQGYTRDGPRILLYTSSISYMKNIVYLKLVFVVTKNLENTNSNSTPNFLQGGIPNLQPSLQRYGVADNNLVGEIPSSICNLSSLDSLYLSENSLEGKIPECLGNLSSSLSNVELQNNNLDGEMPKTFAQGCTLQSFRINNNKVEGSLPRSLANCKDLNSLDVGNNYLNDTFPYWLGNLDRLQVLILRSNRFYGQIDNSDVLVSFASLHVIDLSHNNFSGYLPTEFFENLRAIREGNEKKVGPEYLKYSLDDGSIFYVHDLYFTTKGLEREFHSLVTTWMVIDFSNNLFFGEIPKTLGELHSLIVLNFSHNRLTGSIPSSLGDLLELESLDLSSNKLHGRIPTEMKNLGFLAVLNLSQNNLVGPIPQGKQFDTFTNDSYMGNSGLCGLPLSKSCDNDEETPEKIDPEDDDGDDELNWKFSILMGYGSGLVLGLSMGYIVFTTGRPQWLIRIIKRVEQRFAKWYRSKLFG